MNKNHCKRLLGLVLVCAMLMGFLAMVPGASAEEGYHYTVYYYDFNEAHVDLEATQLHVWDEANKFDLDPVNFTEIVTLSDGRKWMKAEFYTTSTYIGVIPHSMGGWEWQTGNHYVDNTAGNQEVSVYIVYVYEANTYTEMPTVKDQEKRYVIVEYNRPEGDYDQWNIYTWNSGYGSAVTVWPDIINDKVFMIVPVVESKHSMKLGFCMRRTEPGELWAEKDGGDHYIDVPADQTVVKCKFQQGEGIVFVQEYNVGFQRKAAEAAIAFYYRSDEAILYDAQPTLKGKVSVVVNGQEHPMTYNAETERFEFQMDNCQSGDYEYYYIVDGQTKLDRFNDRLNADSTANVLTFKNASDVSIGAQMYYPTMDSEDNNVLTVTFTKGSLTTEEIDSITADLSELGKGTIKILPELMEVTISADRTAEPGEKTIPVTVTDIYGNIYNTSVTVTLEATAGDSFAWDEAVIYMTITDRFFDGNKENNTLVDLEGTLSYHGGDFAGLEAKLDYLKALGVNTVWITPIVLNSDMIYENEGVQYQSVGFHGYWGSDFTRLSPCLGTEEEFKSLIDAIHARGMKLMVDVVLNHAGYGTEEYFNALIPGTNMLRSPAEIVTGSDIYAPLSGLPDFLTELPAVRDQLIAWQVDWIRNFDIDYYRVDTAKHVEAAMLAEFKNELTKVDQDFKLIGEYYGAGYANTAGMLDTGIMDALLDFDFNDKAGNLVGGKIEAAEKFFTNRNAALSGTATLGGFLSSHDEDSFIDGLMNADRTEEEALALAKVAATLQLTAKGQPVIYYGEEIGQHGLSSDYPIQSNRKDLDWEAAAAQEGVQGSMLSHYQKLLSIRAAHKELFARADRTVLAMSNDEGYDILRRAYGDDAVYIALNLNSEVKTVTVAVELEAGTVLTDLYGGGSYTVSEAKELTLSIPAAADGGTMILRVNPPEPPAQPAQEGLPVGMIAVITAVIAAVVAVVAAAVLMILRKKT